MFFELRQLVEEEDAVVRHADLSWLGNGSSSYEAGVAYGMVRRAEGPGGYERKKDVLSVFVQIGIDLYNRLSLQHKFYLVIVLLYLAWYGKGTNMVTNMVTSVVTSEIA